MPQIATVLPKISKNETQTLKKRRLAGDKQPRSSRLLLGEFGLDELPDPDLETNPLPARRLTCSM